MGLFDPDTFVKACGEKRRRDDFNHASFSTTDTHIHIPIGSTRLKTLKYESL